MKKQFSQTDKKEFFLIFLCWLVYTGAYLGKYSYVSNAVVISSFYNVSKADIGLVSTTFFVAYGLGQVVHACFCRYYPKRSIIALSLILSAIVNFILFLPIPFNSIKYLWFLNAVAQSLLWPTLVQTISSFISKDKIKTSVLAMATTVAVGTVLSYLVSSIFVKFATFKITFLFTAFFLVFIAVFWFIGYGKSASKLPLQFVSQDKKKDYNNEKIQKKSKMLPFYIMLGCFILFAIVNNFVKDGLNTWVPIILKEMYNLGDSLSIFLTISLSILGIFGAFTATFLYKYIKNFILLNGLFFTFAALFILAVLGLLNTSLWILVLLCFSIISLLMHAINNVITSMFPLFLPNKEKSGLYSGLLNGACYVGSALSAYGLGAFADNFGWLAVFKLLLVCCLVPIIISAILQLIKAIKKC